MDICFKIKCNSQALGDTLACIGVVEYYRCVQKLGVVEFDCIEWMWDYLRPSYPNIIFKHIDEPQICLDYHFDLPVQKGFAYDLFQIPEIFKYDFDWDFIPPTIEYKPKKAKSIMSKYFTFSMHSTAQVKYWNSGNRNEQTKSPKWRDLCSELSNIGIEGVLVDKHYGFGQAPHWNEPPDNCTKVIGKSFDEVLDTIYYSDFFVGLSSGMSWVALAMGKKTCVIAPWVYADNEFGSSNGQWLRIESKSSCTNCWATQSHNFDKSDWYWCPHKKGTTEEYTCSSSIMATDVINEMKKYNWI